MAIMKQIEEPSGAVAGYWRIIHTQIDHKDGGMTVVLSGYLNQQKRLADAPAITKRTFSLDTPPTGEDPRVSAYAQIRDDHPEFSEAVSA